MLAMSCCRLPYIGFEAERHHTSPEPSVTQYAKSLLGLQSRLR
jgi:hypothetical protein